jgi:hypothetical protein
LTLNCRAFITARYTEPPKLRNQPRRVLCVIKWSSDTLTEVLMSELDTVVDLFIVDRKPYVIFSKEKVLIVKKDQFNWADIKSQLADVRFVENLIKLLIATLKSIFI